jgi:Tol biopolymer transport system component
MAATVERHGRMRLTWAAAGITFGALLIAAPALAGGAKTGLVSVSRAGGEGNGHSLDPSISANGRFVVFRSRASNLVAADARRSYDVFVRDLTTDSTRRVSISMRGGEANAPSPSAAISASGRFVAFSSHASDLVEGDTNSRQDVFVHNIKTGRTRRVSVSSDGEQANGASGELSEDGLSISADGRLVAFSSEATNLVAGDTNDFSDVFVHDLRTRVTRRVSPIDTPSGEPAISANGRFVAFVSGFIAPIVYVRDLKTRQTRRLHVGRYPSISASGRFVAFESDSELVRGDTNDEVDVFVRDVRTGKTRLVSVGLNGTPVNDGSFDSSISASGRFVAFYSDATNLVRRETGRPDVFVRDLKARRTRRMGVGRRPAISADARFVAFDSRSRKRVGDHPRPFLNVFRRGPLR